MQGDPKTKQTREAVYRRVYITVTAETDKDGIMHPKSLRWTDGKTYTIDRASYPKPACAQKAGGTGDRYTVMINGRERYLFYEHNTDPSACAPGRWFVEAKKDI